MVDINELTQEWSKIWNQKYKYDGNYRDVYSLCIHKESMGWLENLIFERGQYMLGYNYNMYYRTFITHKYMFYLTTDIAIKHNIQFDNHRQMIISNSKDMKEYLIGLYEKNEVEGHYGSIQEKQKLIEELQNEYVNPKILSKDIGENNINDRIILNLLEYGKESIFLNYNLSYVNYDNIFQRMRDNKNHGGIEKLSKIISEMNNIVLLNTVINFLIKNNICIDINVDNQEYIEHLYENGRNDLVFKNLKYCSDNVKNNIFAKIRVIETYITNNMDNYDKCIKILPQLKDEILIDKFISLYFNKRKIFQNISKYKQSHCIVFLI